MNNKVAINFSNRQITDINIPSIAILEYGPMERALLKSDLISTALVMLIPFFIVLFMIYGWSVPWVVGHQRVIFLILGVLFLVALLHSYYAYFCKSYALRERDIVYNEGLFWKKTTVIPFNRIQHCEVSQGPVDRFFGLAELKIYTAGGSSSDLTIKGFSYPKAQKIRNFIVLKTGLDEEE